MALEGTRNKKSRFSHWLVRTVGYEAILLSERRAIHRHTAEALEAGVTGGGPVPAQAPANDWLRDHVVRHRDGSSRWSAAAEPAWPHWEQAGDPRRAALYRV